MEVSRQSRQLDYASPKPSFWNARWLLAVLDAGLVFLGGVTVVALIAVGRIILLLTTSPGRLFGLHW